VKVRDGEKIAKTKTGLILSLSGPLQCHPGQSEGICGARELKGEGAKMNNPITDIFRGVPDPLLPSFLPPPMSRREPTLS
jgi:hypothetical protein